MDANLQEILDNLEEKAPRSRLTPCRDLILELRRQSRTYREIQQILADHCQIQVSISTLHDFHRGQRRIDSKINRQQAKKQTTPKLSEKPNRAEMASEENPEMNDVEQRIVALKQRTTPNNRDFPRFDYDPSKPLHLPPRVKKGRAG